MPVMEKVFQTFVDQLEAASGETELYDAAADLATALDIHSFAYLAGNGSSRSRPLLISSYPSSWTDRYLQNGYAQVDPVIQTAATSVFSFEWGAEGPFVDLSDRQKQLFDEAAQFGIKCGLTVPIRQGGSRVAAFTFASDHRQVAFRREITRYKQVMQLVGMYFHSHVRMKIRLAEGGGETRLSPREIECLHWAAQGKTRWETAQILALSARTVVFHLENAKRKLGVNGTSAAVAKAIRDGLLA